MNRPSRPERLPLAARLGAGTQQRFVRDARRVLSLAQFAAGGCLGERAHAFAGRNVLIAAPSQVEAAAALIELDGLAENILLAPPTCQPGIWLTFSPMRGSTRSSVPMTVPGRRRESISSPCPTFQDPATAETNRAMRLSRAMCTRARRPARSWIRAGLC